MTSSVFRAVAALALASTACGSVKDESEDAETRAVACNGGAVDILANGNFDAADPPWHQDPPTGLLCGDPRITPDSGALAGCLGGTDGNTNTLSREVPLPAGATSARLTGRICIATEETDPVDNDTVSFDLLDGVVSIGALGQRTNQQGMQACAFTSFTLEAPLSRDPVTATFRIQSQLDTGKPTSFYVDSLVLTASCN